MKLFRNIEALKFFKDCRVAISIKIDSDMGINISFESTVGEDGDEIPLVRFDEFEFIFIFLVNVFSLVI